jgi:hypothetical protein
MEMEIDESHYEFGLLQFSQRLVRGKKCKNGKILQDYNDRDFKTSPSLLGYSNWHRLHPQTVELTQTFPLRSPKRPVGL